MEKPSWLIVGAEIICIHQFSKGGYRLHPFSLVISSNNLPKFKEHCFIIELYYNHQINDWMVQIKNYSSITFSHRFFQPLIKKTEEDDIEIFNKIKNESKIPSFMLT